jgi:hypothetical protein
MEKSTYLTEPAAGHGLEEALLILDGLVRDAGPTRWIGSAERQLVGTDSTGASFWLETEMVTPETLRAALLIKGVAGQINVLVHALGRLTRRGTFSNPAKSLSRSR